MAKHALLIGINEYQVPGFELRGCVNDVSQVRGLLADSLGFGEILTLTDARATRQTILESLRQLVARTNEGDVLLIHFSGHGSNLPDRIGDEADFREQVLCPYDLDWRDPLDTRRFRELLNQIPDGVNCTFITDCSFSGTATRMLPAPLSQVRQRFLPSPWDLIATESGRTLTGSLYGQTSLESSSQNRAIVAITAAGFGQVAMEAKWEGKYYGVLTRALSEVLAQSRGNLSYRELHRYLLREIHAGGHAQRPELHGLEDNLDLPFLSSFPQTSSVRTPQSTSLF
jgi:hypothetical protein